MTINPEAIKKLKEFEAGQCKEILATLPAELVAKISAASKDDLRIKLEKSFSVKDFFRPEVIRLGFDNFRLAGFVSSDLKEAILLVSNNKYGHWALSAALGLTDEHPEYVKFEVDMHKFVSLSSYQYTNKRGGITTLSEAEGELFIARAKELTDKFFSEETEIDLGKEWLYDGEKFSIAGTSNMREPTWYGAPVGSFRGVIRRIAELKAGKFI